MRVLRSVPVLPMLLLALAATILLVSRSADVGVQPADGVSTVVVIVVGELRNMLTPVVSDSLHLLVKPLRGYAARNNGAVHLHICIETHTVKAVNAIHNFTYGGLIPNRVWGHNARSMLGRWAMCYKDVRQYAQQREQWEGYRWVVRVRPDTAFFSVPSIESLSQDAVYARARKFGGLRNVCEGELSWPLLIPGSDTVCKGTCVRSRSRKKTPSCLVIDDQLAFIPARFAAVYFAVDKPAGPPPDFPMLEGPGDCAKPNIRWPETNLSCRLLQAGARLEVLRGINMQTKYRAEYGWEKHKLTCCPSGGDDVNAASKI